MENLEKVEEWLLLHISDSDSRYAIEYKIGNEKKHKVYTILANLIKIFSFVSGVLAFIINYYLLIGFGLGIILSIVFEVIGAQSMYTVQCVYKDNNFKIIKINVSGKESIVEDISIEEVKQISIIENIDANEKNVYLEEQVDYEYMNITRIECSKKIIYFLTDNYMYSLLGEKK